MADCERCKKHPARFGSKFCETCGMVLRSLFTPGYGPKDFRYGINWEYHPSVRTSEKKER